MRAANILLALAALGPAACGRQVPAPPQRPTSTFREATAAELDAGLSAQRERALAAVQTMASRLKGALHEALERGGPPEAIAVCRSVAPAIAADVAEEYRLELGRTSFALRSPANRPPDWAGPMVEARRAEPAFLVGSNGELAALLPIRLGQECQMCHGPAESISDEARSVLARVYPKDQATGFVAGELRGWFWVVVPAAAATDR